MAHLWRYAAVVLLGISLACARAEAPTVASETTPIPATGGSSFVPTDQFVLGQFQLAIDLESLTARIEPAAREAATQPPQNLQYDLDPRAVGIVPSLRVVGVELDAEGDLVVALEHAHPLPRPDFAAAATATNRADLGYTGRLLVLADDTHAAFFEGQVELDPDLVKGADGFVDPGALLAATPRINSAFPFVLLVDETQDSRVDRSNAGVMTGNYDAASGGWQRANAGEGDGWTGYDYLHAGQVTRCPVTVRRAALATRSGPLDLALLVQYTDPRGRTARASRFPSDPVDPRAFAYRLPYAALDCSQVVLEPMRILAVPEVEGVVSLGVRDWDLAATESTAPALGDEEDVALIEEGGAGPPNVTWDLSSLGDGFEIEPLPSLGSGIPGDEYRVPLALASHGTMAVRDYAIAARVTDASEVPGGPMPDRLGVHPLTGVPATALALERSTIQVSSLRVLASNPRVESSPEVVCPGGVRTFSAIIGPPVDEFDWAFGGGVEPLTSTAPTPQVTVTATGAFDGVLRVRTGVFWNTIHFSYGSDDVAGLHLLPTVETIELDDREPIGMTLIGDHIVIAAQGVAPLAHVVIVTSETLEPIQTSDWSSHTLPLEHVWRPPSVHTSFLETVEGRLVLPLESGLAITRTSAPDAPSDAADWEIGQLPADLDRPGGIGLVGHEGRIALASRAAGSEAFLIHYAPATVPLTTASWESHVAIDFSTGTVTGRSWPTIDSAATLAGPRLVLGVSTEGPSGGYSGVLSAYATAGLPVTPAEWTVAAVAEDVFAEQYVAGGTVLAIPGPAGEDRLAMSWVWVSNPKGLGGFTEYHYALCPNPRPASPLDWSELTSLGADAHFIRTTQEWLAYRGLIDGVLVVTSRGEQEYAMGEEVSALAMVVSAFADASLGVAAVFDTPQGAQLNTLQFGGFCGP